MLTELVQELNQIYLLYIYKEMKQSFKKVG